jgi:hypothetical protein
MEQKTIADPEVQDAVSHFVNEARQCARTAREDNPHGILGYAALSTIFSCVLATGEAVIGKQSGVRTLIEAICREMGDKRSWLLPPEGTIFNEAIAVDLLTELRNGLAHALCIPEHVVLFPDRGIAERSRQKKWRIIVPDFVDAVEKAVRSITTQHPDLVWDPTASGRGPAAVTPIYDSSESPITSASSIRER